MPPAVPGTDRSWVLNTGSGFTSRMPALRLCQSRACCGVICQYSGLPAARILSSTACTCRSSDTAGLILGIGRLDERVSLLLRFEDVRRHPPARQRFTKLEPEKCAGRISRRGRVVVRLHVPYHRRVGVGHGGVDQKVIVVDHECDLLSNRLATLLDHAADAVDVVTVANVQSFDIEKHDIALGVVAHALRDADAEQRFLELHGLVAKDAWIHQPRIADDRRELHLGEYVPHDVDSRCDFDQLHARPPPAETRTAPSRTTPAARSPTRTRR